MKCPDCGLEFDSSQQECPNCGCPASSCKFLEETIPQQTESNVPQKIEGQNIDSSQPKERKKTFEIVCYCLAGLSTLLFIFTPTSRGGYVNFDGSDTALRYEIAAFGWLIAGRLTAILNK